MFGYHSGLPSFMINTHRVTNEKDAHDYISRIQDFKRVFDEKMVFNKKQKELGILPPKFVYDKIISDSKNIISGVPFDNSKIDSPLLEDFKKKIKRLKISKKKRVS